MCNENTDEKILMKTMSLRDFFDGKPTEVYIGRGFNFMVLVLKQSKVMEIPDSIAGFCFVVA